MKYPTDNFKRDWNTTAGYGFGDWTDYGYHEGVDLPFLKFRIFPIVRLIMNFHMTIKAYRPQVSGIGISSSFIKMMYKKIYSSTHRLFPNTTKFTVFSKILSVERTAIFIVPIFDSLLLTFKRFFQVCNSKLGNISTFRRTVFSHFTSVYFKTWRDKWFLTKQTLENKIESTLRHTRFLTKSFPNQVIHSGIIYGLHEGVKI